MEERLRFEAMTDGRRQFGISRKTGYKIFDRYKEHGHEAICRDGQSPLTHVRYPCSLWLQSPGNALYRSAADRPARKGNAMTTFTPLASLLGGILIGVAAVALMAFEGRVAGISGIASRLLPPYRDGETLARAAFILGLVLAPVSLTLIAGYPVIQTVSRNLPLMVVAGLLVGFGTVLGNGCTSGHGVCGIARFSARSIVATLVFMAVAFATVFVTRHVVGG